MYNESDAEATQYVVLFFFCKQKTAYDMCGRDWSSDVCSSDLMVNILVSEYVHDPLEQLVFVMSILVLPLAVGPTIIATDIIATRHNLHQDPSDRQ